ncbi:AzlC family ABC transporter permease [Dactylosporangium sp. AC04546]|uniref:AzlC family ABC transporter permease n=1 Tax=Dactylosporangium sp. AC04546 TaxID=2862460 RepID=UPI001EDEC48E|nr:AzlC family ABC transporter permease [Dactylosporangium sp. AC04546]WVK86735.1 AzlC family ABC transporter permease [Dactylosporangium sp. AC04546]
MTVVGPPRSRRTSDLRTAAHDSGVIWLGMFALGVGFGVLVVDHGLPWWLAPIISGTMFAGSVEFIMIGMLAAAAPVTAVALTTFLINSRHLFYGLSFPLHRVRGRLGKAYSIFALCDEAYALMTSKDPKTLTSGRILFTQAGQHLSWAGGSLAGAVIGHSLLGDVQGLGFVLTALFVALAVDAYRTRPDKTTLALAAGAAVLAFVVAPGSMLLVAMSVFTVCLVVRHRIPGARRA